ncbi:hypothetical protein HDV05_000814 [Chytridiales sp. JEL 0842]|nr:hypothetical protein HDV05_000814 [Chytridiales sp. JEL 0842]
MARLSDADVDRMARYNFDEDTAFQAGLESIISGMKGKPESEVSAAIEKAKVFYYSKFVAPQYLATEPPSGTQAPPTTEEPIIHQPKVTDSTPLTTTDPKESDDSTPKYPKTFAELCAMVARGEPIPGIKQIPDTVHGTASVAKIKPRRKPWESAE